MQTEASARKKARQERDAIEAEMIVRETAARKGIKDVDYALRLVTRELAGKTDEDVAKFDEAKFFDGLRETHPYLFGETTKPVTTGNGAGAAPPTPTPGAAQQSAAQGSQADARKMDQKQYQDHLRARGLSINL
jgi:hypothetical protein